MSQETIITLLAPLLFVTLFYWSIFPFLSGERQICHCPACSTELTRYGWCATCRVKKQQ